MITLFDSHAHLDSRKFNDDRSEVIKRAKDAGVKYILNAGSDIKSSQRTLQLAKEEEMVYAALGVHPHEAKYFDNKTYETFKSLAGEEKVVAIGEIGFDFYYNHSNREAQTEAFKRQIELAREVSLPVIIHNRDAHRDTMDMLREMKAEEAGGVLHCFSGSVEIAEEALKMGFYISLAGPVTFKNSRKSREVAEIVPEDKLMIETDCPYLSPEPKRGRRNEPAYVAFVAQKIADIRGETPEKVAEYTTNNAKRLFKIEN